MENKPNFTNEQISAIESTGNVIVSAGAGSGKTTVLTERVRRNVLGIIKDQEPVKLDELLILTFTNDAASSMKSKIKEALGKEETLKHLVPFVDSAHIETFDAYAQFIVSKYGHFENYPKNLNIIEEDILTIKSASFLDDILEKLYEKEDPTLNEIVFLYCSKGDKAFVSFLRNIYFDILSKRDDPIGFLTTYKNNFLNQNFFQTIVNNLNSYVKETVSQIRTYLSSLSTLNVRTKLIDGFGDLFKCETIKDLNIYKPTFEKFELNKFSPLKKEIRDENKLLNHIGDEETEIIDEIRDLYKSLYNLGEVDLNTFVEKDINYQIKYLTFIVDNILVPLINKIETFKYSTGFFTFSDVAKMATTIVKNNEEVRNELRNQYKLIMIDEYQDTSDTQEEFINLIANNTVFSVGDIKQSIYRFRGARPDLFKQKYDLYKNDDNKGHAINMNKNFRSRKEIINPINDMFSNLMFNDFGGADYRVDHIIDPANEDYDKYGKGKFEHGMFQISHSNYLLDNPLNLNAGKGKLAECNAKLIAYDIKNRIKNGYEVYDRKTKAVRKARYSDFTILAYKSKKFDTFEKVFKDYDIPLNAIYDESIRNDISIIIISNLFKLLYLLGLDELNSLQKSEVKHLLISIFRSYIFNYSDQQLYDLFNDDKYENDENYKRLLALGKKYKNEPLHEIYIDIIKELDYLGKASLLKNVLNSIDKNNIFYSKTKTMDKLGYTLNDLASYIKDADTLEVKMDQTIYSEACDAVTLTTVHKSKGLEYPLVYLPCLRDFTAPKEKNNGDYYLFDNSFFLPMFSDPKKAANLLGLALVRVNKSFNEDAEERLRLLYVALTRAKEDIVYVNDYDNIFDERKLNNRLNDEFTKKFQSNQVNEFARVLDSSISERKQFLNKIRKGRNFDDFLRKADIDFPLSNFMDDEFDDLLGLIENVIISHEFDFKEEPASDAMKKIIKMYEENNFSFDGIDIEEYLVDNYPQMLKEFDDNQKNKKDSEEVINYEVLFEGVKKVNNDRIIKILAKFYTSNIKIEVTTFPNVIKNFSFNNAKEYELFRAKIANDDFSDIAIKLKLINVSQNEESEKFYNLPKATKTFELKELHIKPEIIEKTKKASKDLDDEVDDGALIFGTHMHALLEMIDFNKPDLTIIKNTRERAIIQKAVGTIQMLDIKDSKIFKEYQFTDIVNNVNGAIDLLIIKEDKAIIIDYKLKNIDDIAYVKQLEAYKTFIKKAFKIETVETYLLSIMESTIKKID